MSVYPDNIEQKIDFTAIRTMLAGACTSVLGREQVEAITFLTDRAAILSLLREADELQRILSDGSLDFPRGDIEDVREAVGRIRIEGLYLNEQELHDLRKTLDYAARLDSFFRSLDSHRFPIWSENSLKFKVESVKKSSSLEVESLKDILRLIDRVLDSYGQIADSASPEMHRIRKDLRQAQGSANRALLGILHQAQADGYVDKDVAPTMREGRLVIPVSPAYKRKIGGIVHDESATGKTVYIEPQQVVEANNHIRELEGEQARERIRILQEVSGQLRVYMPSVKEAEALLAHVDFVRAKVIVAKQQNAIMPQVSDDSIIDLREARNPILEYSLKWKVESLKKPSSSEVESLKVVPLDIKLNKENRVLVISGPNAGGKSVCLKTVGLLQYMMQCGLLVPLREDSQMSIFDKLMIDIGDEQSIDDDLSTYSSHLRNMKAFARYADKKTLLLIDEFGTGTEPLLGGAIAEAVLTQLVQQQAFGVITTHYTNLKHFAEVTEGVQNGAMLYDRGQLKPLFQLSQGQAGSSFAIEIARQIGLPETIIAKATELIGSEHIDYDKSLQDIARDKRYWENKRQNIRQREKHLEEKIAYYETEIAGLKAKRKEVLAKAQEEAADLLKQSNATIERTIREIKEAKADKVRTREARAKVESLKLKVESESLKLKVESGKKSSSLEVESGKLKDKKQVLHDFRDLKPVAKSMALQNPTVSNTIRQHKLHFERTLDLRGLRADEALEQTIAYIDDAIMVGAGEVCVLHGTGTGALKQVVRDYLKKRKLDFRDGDIDHGGAGVTMVDC